MEEEAGLFFFERGVLLRQMNDDEVYSVSETALSEGISEPPPLPELSEEPEKEPWNGWWTLIWGMCAVFVFILAQSMGAVAYIIATEGFSSDPEVWEESIRSIEGDGDGVGVIAFLAIFAVCPFCWGVGKVRENWRGMEYLGNQKTVWWKWLMWHAIIFAAMILFGIIGPYIGIKETPDSMLKMGASTDYAILLFLGVAVGAPLVEEFIFRGILFRGWEKSKMGLWGTLILTSLLWTVMHVQYDLPTLSYLFFLGLILGLARHFTGSVWVPVGMHAMNNAMATVVLLYGEHAV